MGTEDFLWEVLVRTQSRALVDHGRILDFDLQMQRRGVEGHPQTGALGRRRQQRGGKLMAGGRVHTVLPFLLLLPT